MKSLFCKVEDVAWSLWSMEKMIENMLDNRAFFPMSSFVEKETLKTMDKESKRKYRGRKSAETAHRKGHRSAAPCDRPAMSIFVEQVRNVRCWMFQKNQHPNVPKWDKVMADRKQKPVNLRTSSITECAQSQGDWACQRSLRRRSWSSKLPLPKEVEHIWRQFHARLARNYKKARGAYKEPHRF